MTQTWHEEMVRALGTSWNDAPDLARLDTLLADPSRPEDSWARRDSGRTTYLWHAAGARNLPAIEFLLSRGAPVDEPVESRPLPSAALKLDGEDGAPLDLAARCVHLLLDAGAEVDALDSHGYTALEMAIGGDGTSHSAMRVLLERGANPDAPIPRGGSVFAGGTVLHYAEAWTSPRAVALLLRHGADPTLVDEQGDTALTRAHERLADLETEKRTASAEAPNHSGVGRTRPIDDPTRDTVYQEEVRAFARGEREESPGLSELLEESDGAKLRCIIALLKEAMGE